MRHLVRGFMLGATLVFVLSLALASAASAQSTPSAYVYVQSQGPAGAVHGFRASSTGQLNAIPGSPFKLGTKIIGGTGTKFFTLGKTLIHSYPVAADGAIEAQKAQINVFNYSGSSCGDQNNGLYDAVLDHTGKYIYVLLQAGVICAAYQSYQINSDGSFAFDGDTELDMNQGSGYNPSVPSILKNESFAYAFYDFQDQGPVLTGFRRESSGTLEQMQFNENDPTLPNDYYVAGFPDASPAGNYLAVQLHAEGGGPVQLASYTVDSQGNISTTNTSSNMPATAFINPTTKFSSSGGLLAVAGDGAESNGKNGIEIYKFNGSAPYTLARKLLTGTPIDGLAWDSANHLYAFSTAGNKVYVFTVTSTSAMLDGTTVVGTPYKMVVVSQ